MLRFTPGLLEDARRRYVVLVPKAHLELFIGKKLRKLTHLVISVLTYVRRGTPL